MKDILTESIVPAVPTVVQRLLKLLLMAVIAIGVLGVVVFLSQAILAAAVCAAAAGGGYFLLNRLMEKTDGEYEYIHSNSQLDIDVVIRASRRRHLMTIDLERVELLAPVGHGELSRYESLSKKDFTGNALVGEPYCMVVLSEGGSRRVLLNLDEKMKKSLKYWLRDKVKQ